MNQERTPATLIVILGILALAAAGGGALLLQRRSAEAERAAVEAARDEAEAAAAYAGARAGETAAEPVAPGAASAAALEAACRKTLAEFGFGDVDVAPDSSFITGRVVTRREPKDGAAAPPDEGPAIEPVAGADVAIHRVGDDAIADTTAEGSVKTRADGRWLATVRAGPAWELAAGATGFLETRRRVAKPAAYPSLQDTGDLLISKPARVLATVTSGDARIEATKPVEGMAFTVTRADGTEVAKGSSDKEGKVSFGGLPREKLRFRGELAPYGSVDEEVDVARDGQEQAFNVQLVGRLRVQVRSPAGAVLSRFAATLDLRYENYGYRPPDFVEVETKDPDGWHLIENLKAGPYDLYATAKSYAVGLVTTEIVAGETREVSVTLPLGFPLEGRVVAKKDGAPIANAIVYSEKDLISSTVDTDKVEGYRPMARATRTDERGRFRLEDLTEGIHRIAAVHKDFAEEGLEAVTVGKDSASADIVIRLPVGATLTGHSYAPDGSPVEGDMVMALGHLAPARVMKKKAPRMAYTDAAGWYRIDRITPGQRLVLRTAEKRRIPGRPPFEMKQLDFVDAMSRTLDFGRNESGATLVGRVTDAAGAPATGVVVMLMRHEPGATGVPEFFQSALDDDGNYEIRGLREGRHAFQIAKAGKGSDFAGTEPVEIPATGVVRKDFVLTGGRIEGMVVDAETKAPMDGGEVVILRGTDVFVGRCEIDRAGTFSFPHVEAGVYTVFASAPDHGNLPVNGVEVRSGETTVVPTIELRGGGRIVGLVLDAAGAPVPQAQIVRVDPATQDTQDAWSLGSDSDGRFSAEYVPNGSWLISARKAGLDFEPVPVSVTTGSAPVVTIRAR